MMDTTGMTHASCRTRKSGPWSRRHSNDPITRGHCKAESKRCSTSGTDTMRIDSLRLDNYPPLRHFEISTSSNVVIIAGANGSGKTRLKQALIETFTNPGGPRANMTLGATRPEEEKAWGGKILSVTAGQRSAQLQTYMS